MACDVEAPGLRRRGGCSPYWCWGCAASAVGGIRRRPRLSDARRLGVGDDAVHHRLVAGPSDPSGDPRLQLAGQRDVDVRQGAAAGLRDGARATQSVVSGLAAGTYFWRVQAVSQRLRVGPVLGRPERRASPAPGPGAPARPSLNQPRGGSSFHPWESFGMSWTRVPRCGQVRARGVEGPRLPGQRRGLPVGAGDAVDGHPDHDGRSRQPSAPGSSRSTRTATTACRRT